MFESSTAAIQRLHKEYDDNTLRKLNSDTLILTAYETAFPTEKKYGGQVKREIERKIQEDAKRVEILTTETQEAVKSSPAHQALIEPFFTPEGSARALLVDM